jgi:hypothetical protein
MRRIAAVAVLLLTLTACAPTTLAPTTSSAPAASARVALWGQISRDCACRDGESLARVTAGLQQADLAVDLRLESKHDGWQVFSVTFDPAHVSTDDVKRAIEDSGAELLAAPPAE